MSAICIVDLKNHNLQFDSFNKLANEIVGYSLDNNLAVFFNSYDYGVEITKDANMRSFFLMSDSFLYKNCDFLDTSSLSNLSDESFKKKFLEKYKFFDDIIDIIFAYGIKEIEVYISEDGSVDSVNDFEIIRTTQKHFLKSLLDSVLNSVEEYAYGFPTVKFYVYKE